MDHKVGWVFMMKFSWKFLVIICINVGAIDICHFPFFNYWHLCERVWNYKLAFVCGTILTWLHFGKMHQFFGAILPQETLVRSYSSNYRDNRCCFPLLNSIVVDVWNALIVLRCHSNHCILQMFEHDQNQLCKIKLSGCKKVAAPFLNWFASRSRQKKQCTRLFSRLTLLAWLVGWGPSSKTGSFLKNFVWLPSMWQEKKVGEGKFRQLSNSRKWSTTDHQLLPTSSQF